jgi:MFS family permease
MENEQLVAPRRTADVLPYAPAKPTRARFGVLAFLCTLALLLYIDRVCIGQAASHIRKEFELSEQQMSWVFNAFLLAYCLFEVPAGHWGDRYGSRGVIARVVVCWSIFTALTGAAIGLSSLILIRFLFGAGEAGAFPNAARVVTRWFPTTERGRVRGAITFVSLVGAIVAPILSSHLIELVGWRPTFAIFGVLGIVWAVAFYGWFRDDPAKHWAANATELALIREPVAGAGINEDDASAATHGIPWSRVLTSPNLWLLGFIMTASGALFYMLFQWYPSYLKAARGQSEISSGWLTAAVMSGGAVGCLLGGWLSDFVIRHTSARRWPRSLCGAGCLLAAGLAALSVRFTGESTAGVTLCNFLALMFMQAGVPTWWSVVAETSGRHGAAMWGLMNSMASLGLVGANVLVGRLVDLRQRAGMDALHAWSPVFDGVAVGLLAGGVAWLLVNATRSIVEPRLTAA